MQEAQSRASNIEKLENKYKEIQNKRGILKAVYEGQNKSVARFVLPKNGKDDFIKNTERQGIEQYKNGEITYEEAQKKLSNIESVDTVAINTFANMLTSILATLAGIAVKARYKKSAPFVYLASILTGIIAKVGIKTIDRGMNNIEGDTFDLKQIGKDAFFGAVNGLFSGINADFGKQLTKATLGIKGAIEVTKQAGMLIVGKFINDHYLKNNNEANK